MDGNEHVLIGLGTTGLCLLGIARTQWFLDHTTKGQRLVRRFGMPRARHVFRAMMASGAIFGLLLATGILKPIQW